MPTSTACRLLVPILAVAALLVPRHAAGAQSYEPEVVANPWSVDVEAGGWWRRGDAASAGRDSDGAGMLATARLGYAARPRLRLVASGSYGRRSDRWREIISLPGGGSTLRYHRDEIVLATAGAEVQALAGPTSLWVGVEAGLGWDRWPPTGRPGAAKSYPYPPRNAIRWREYSPVVVPTVTVRRLVSAHLDVALGMRLPYGGRFEFVRTPFALAGVTWRP